MAHEMFALQLCLLGWGPSWKGKGSEIFPFSCSPAFLHTPSWSNQDPTFLVAAHLAQFPGDSTTLSAESQNSLGWKRPLKVIWSIHLLKPGLSSVRTGCSGLCPVELWPSHGMEIPCPVWAMCSSMWPNSQRIFSQHRIENFHGKTLSFTLHLHLLLHSDSWKQHDNFPSAFSTPSWSHNSCYAACSGHQPSLDSPNSVNLGLVWGSSAWVQYCQRGLTRTEQRKPAMFPWCAGDAAPYAFSLHCHRAHSPPASSNPLW